MTMFCAQELPVMDLPEGCNSTDMHSHVCSGIPVLQVAQIKSSAAGADVAVLVHVDLVVRRDEAV